MFVSYSCEPEQTEENLGIVQQVLADVQQKGITEEELRQAKSKILSRMVRASERPMGRMNVVGMSWTYLRRYRSVDDELQAYDAVTLKSIRNFHWDMQLLEYNGAPPHPQEIRSMLPTR